MIKQTKEQRGSTLLRRDEFHTPPQTKKKLGNNSVDGRPLGEN